MKTNNIISFSIRGLFGDRDVHIPFKNNIKILIGENGLGKTTVLNMLYYILTNRFYKLKDFDFRSFEIVFSDNRKIEIERQSIADEDEIFEVPQQILSALSNSLTKSDLKDFFTLFETNASRNLIIDRLERTSYNRLFERYPTRYLVSGLRILTGYGEHNKQLRHAKELLEKELQEIEILYFPTFRRIEEDLINLGLDDEKNKINQRDVRIIQFGMKDVREKLDDIKKDINTLSSKGLSQISSEILSQLVKGVPEINESTLKNISKKDIDIMLARVGEAITKEDKIKITSIISSKEKIKEIDNKYLIYFLEKLISIYEQQREIDSKIESFVSICNKYLKYTDKEIQYEASEVDFYLVTRTENREKRVALTQLLSKLSSGEKQIISLFTRIYLSDSKSFIVLFDEPELSLSIFWQKILLPDIVASQKCKFLLSVTHSPFIFENELVKYATSLNKYIKLSQ